MPKQRKIDSDDNIKTLIAGFEADLDKLKVSGDEAEKAEVGARKTLYASLGELFEFGIRLKEEPSITRAVIEKAGETDRKAHV